MTTASQLRLILENIDLVLNRVDALHVKVNDMANQLDAISTSEVVQTQKENTMAKSLDDIIATQAQAAAAIQKTSDLEDSIMALVTNSNTLLTDLKAQLAAAIAAGADPAKLQTLSDSIDAALASELANADKATAIVVAGTPAA